MARPVSCCPHPGSVGRNTESLTLWPIAPLIIFPSVLTTVCHADGSCRPIPGGDDVAAVSRPIERSLRTWSTAASSIFGSRPTMPQVWCWIARGWMEAARRTKPRHRQHRCYRIRAHCHLHRRRTRVDDSERSGRSRRATLSSLRTRPIRSTAGSIIGWTFPPASANGTARRRPSTPRFCWQAP